MLGMLAVLSACDSANSKSSGSDTKLIEAGAVQSVRADFIIEENNLKHALKVSEDYYDFQAPNFCTGKSIAIANMTTEPVTVRLDLMDTDAGSTLGIVQPNRALNFDAPNEGMWNIALNSDANHILFGFLTRACDEKGQNKINAASENAPQPVVKASGMRGDAIWADGQRIGGNCRVRVMGETLMDGLCSGAGHGDSVFVTAERDGCSIELSRDQGTVLGKVFAYKDTCGSPESAPNKADVSLGPLVVEGGCWHSKLASICLEPIG